MCCTPLCKNIDNTTVFSEFSAFLKTQMYEILWQKMALLELVQ